MNEWKEYKLGELAEITSSKRIFYSDYVLEGIPFFRSKEIIEKALGQKTNETLYISKEKYDDIKQKFGSPIDGDLLISAVGERAGIPYVVKDLGDFYFKDGNLIWLRNIKSELNIDYFCYWLKSIIGQFSLESIMIGSAQKALTIIGLKNLEISIPNSSSQKTIASILSSLDDKIDLLHSQNATLEAMAETLFRQWFVEEAKEDWEETNLFDSIELIGGGTPKTENAEYWDGNIKWLSCGDISANHKNFVVRTEKSITEIGLQNSSAKLLPKFSTVISARGTVGKYCLLSEPMAYSQSNYGIKPKFEGCFFFTYLLVAYSVNELQAAAYGSVFDTITTTTFKELKISLPESLVIQEFEEIAKPYFKKMFNNQNQIRTLTSLRDTLLPKLMSGEVRVEI